MQFLYYYSTASPCVPGSAVKHQQICDLLSQLRTTGRVSECVIQPSEVAFPTDKERQELFTRLREFAVRHRVQLAHTFGSRKHGFCYLPPQFLLVLEGDALREVFPCRIGDDEIEPLEFLEGFAVGQPWTNRSTAGRKGTKHKILIARIVAAPGTLEPGLVVQGQNVQVSRDFGELGFVDLVFSDREGRSLLVEVKVEPDELDKAIGQILRHRQLFGQQNRIEESAIRMGIACPYIPPQYRSLCEQLAIGWFEIPSEHQETEPRGMDHAAKEY